LKRLSESTQYRRFRGLLWPGSGLNILIRINKNNYFVSPNFKMKDYHTNKEGL